MYVCMYVHMYVYVCTYVCTACAWLHAHLVLILKFVNESDLTSL